MGAVVSEDTKKKPRARKSTTKNVNELELKAKPKSSKPKRNSAQSQLKRLNKTERQILQEMDDANTGEVGHNTDVLGSEEDGKGAIARFNNLTLETFQAMENTIASLQKRQNQEQTTIDADVCQQEGTEPSSAIIIDQLKAQVARLEDEKEALQYHKSTLKDRIEILQDDKKELQAEKKALKIKVAKIINSVYSSLESATSRAGAAKRVQLQSTQDTKKSPD